MEEEQQPQPYYLKHHEGSVVTFNLTSVRRSKGKDGVSLAEKFISFKDSPIITRLILKPHPWLLVHQGVREIVKSPLTVQVRQNTTQPNVVHAILRNTARRVRNGVEYPIDRHYQLTFLTKCEAMVFVTAYNQFLMSGNNNESAEERQGDEEAVQEEEETDQAGEVEEEEVEQRVEHDEDDDDYAGFPYFEGQHTQDPFADYFSD